jgi:phage shock protein A
MRYDSLRYVYVSLRYDMYIVLERLLAWFLSTQLDLGFRLSHLHLHLLELQGDLVKVRQSYAEVTATQRRLLKQKEQATAVSEDWYKRAQLALTSGNDELAREALSRRQQNMDQAAELQQQIDFQAASIDKLYEGMQQLEAKILESRSKKEQMVARARTAASTTKVNDMLGGLTGKTSMDAFNRMEEKVEALEAAAEVSSEMGSLGGKALPGSAESSIEKQFKLLEGGAAVDDELAKMKGLLMGGPSSTTASDGSSSASTPPPPASSPAVDDEFEKMKKEAGL